MDSIIIRASDINDSSGIQHIHRNDDDPWHDPEECRSWIEKRLERGFYIQVAQTDEKIIGHGELLITDSPEGRFLYLGMLQTDEDYQGLGIGRKMIDDAARYAKENRCNEIVTIPDSDNTSIVFYEKCGFIKRRPIKSSLITTLKSCNIKNKVKEIAAVPQSVISEIPFVFGLAQASSRHMWEVCNHKPVTDNRKTPAIILNENSYAQLSYFDGDDSGLILFWSKCPTKEDIEAMLSFAHSRGLAKVCFKFFENYVYLFDGQAIETDDIGIYKPVFFKRRTLIISMRYLVTVALNKCFIIAK